jgi:phosphotriesterase-related protein
MDEKIRTVLGLINPNCSGVTIMHEHLLMDATPGWWQEPILNKDKAISMVPVTMDKLGYLRHNPLGIKDNLILDDPKIAQEELLLFQKVGGGTLVELSIIGLGPDHRIDQLIKISQKSEVKIVSGTGFYLDNTIPDEYRDWSIDQLKEHMVKELTIGIGESGACAGIIGEVGTSAIITPFEEKSLIASAHAQQETGASITVHVAPDGSEGLKILQILKKAGANLNRVILDHMDERLDHDYHRAIADTGAVLEFDTFGAEWYYSTVDIAEPRDLDRINSLIQLIDKGYINQITLSHDVWLKQCWVHYGGLGYAHLLEHVVPMLKKRGISNDQIYQLVVENPKRLLAF